jgi:hypothetical protein
VGPPGQLPRIVAPSEVIWRKGGANRLATPGSSIGSVHSFMELFSLLLLADLFVLREQRNGHSQRGNFPLQLSDPRVFFLDEI